MQVAVILLLVVVMGGIFGRFFSHNNPKKQSVLSPTPAIVVTKTLENKKSVEGIGVVTSPSVIIAGTSTPTPTLSEQTQIKPGQNSPSGITIDNFIYPGSTFSRKDGDTYIYIYM